MTNLLDKLTRIYIREITRRHGVPVSAILDRDPISTSRFLESFQQVMRTKLSFSITFHPQIDGQYERTIPTLETY